MPEATNESEGLSTSTLSDSSGAAPKPKPKRTIGHYVLLVIAVFFFAELFLFLTTALTNAGRHQSTAIRFLILSIAVFITAVVALHGFARQIQLPGTTCIALLLLQPGASALSNFIGGIPRKPEGFVVPAAIVGVVLLFIIVRRNSAQERAAV